MLASALGNLEESIQQIDQATLDAVAKMEEQELAAQKLEQRKETIPPLEPKLLTELNESELLDLLDFCSSIEARFSTLNSIDLKFVNGLDLNAFMKPESTPFEDSIDGEDPVASLSQSDQAKKQIQEYLMAIVGQNDTTESTLVGEISKLLEMFSKEVEGRFEASQVSPNSGVILEEADEIRKLELEIQALEAN